MKEYYYLKGKEQKGPFSIENLSDKSLTSETLVWTDGMDNWEKIKEIDELNHLIKTKSVPPPPPSDLIENISRIEVSGELKVTTDKTPNPNIEAIKPTRKTLKWLLIWSSLHLFALLMSVSRVDFFNNRYSPRKDKFWPFVKVWDEEWDSYNGGIKEVYNGIFYNYDWTEFAFYVGGAVLIYIIVRVSNKEESSLK